MSKINDIIVALTAARGKKSKNIVSSFKRFEDWQLVIFRNRMLELLNDIRIKEMRFGGAIGGDTVLLTYALLYRKGTRPKLTVMLPVDLHFQSSETYRATQKADRLIEMKQEPRDSNGKIRTEIFKNRNGILLEYEEERADVLEAFWTGQKIRSGTWSTISMARKLDIKVNVNMLNGA